MRSLQVREDSAWRSAQVADYLNTTRNPLRLSVVTRRAPLIVPLWFFLESGRLWCACQSDALLVRAIATGSDCGIDVSDNDIPYRGVRGQGRATVWPAEGPRVLRRLVDRYLPSAESEFAQWLLRRADCEVAIAVDPSWITAWDFSGRMTDVVGD